MNARVGRLAREQRGQMSVELAVVLPVVIVLVAIVLNALTFFSECAEFDRAGRNTVRLWACASAYGQTLDQAAAAIESDLGDLFAASNESVAVRVSQNSLGHATFELTLAYAPTLFGLGVKDEVFGVALPKLSHTTRLVVDPYKPGVLL